MTFGRKKKTATLGLIVLVASAFINKYLFLSLVALYALGILALAVFMAANKAVKKTNWWKNKFAFTHQFVSNAGYRKNLIRNYEVANVGSNPARFAFFYEDVLGQNWSSGTQGLDMDLEVLRFNHSYLKKGAPVILPIVAFSSVSGFLTKVSRPYMAKFVSILDGLQINYNDKLREGRKYLKYPLLYDWKAVRHLFFDTELDRRLDINEQPMQLIEMEQDAQEWMKIWKDEFRISDVSAPLPDHLKEGREKSVKMMIDMVNFLKERGYKPVIVSPPMSASLMKHFTKDVRDTYIYSFVDEIKKRVDVPYMDYMDSEFQNNKYYFNALFMNLRGRKMFTKRVLTDLSLIKN